MKARIEKNKQEKIPRTRIVEEKVPARSFGHKPKSIEIITVIKEQVRKDYYEFIKENEQMDKTEILLKMLSKEYIGKYHPQTVEIKKVVRRCVENLIESLAEERTKELIENQFTVPLDEELLKKEVDRLKKFKLKTGSFNTEKLDKLIEFYSEKLETIRTYKIAEVRYYNAVKGFTNNFAFLVEDENTYYSKYGGKNKAKFASVDDYYRFINLRKSITTCMKTNNSTEHVAIGQLLNNTENSIKVADKKILQERQKIIEQEQIRYNFER